MSDQNSDVVCRRLDETLLGKKVWTDGDGGVA
jgi:hypothetical protein